MIRDIKRVTASGSLFIAVLFASGCSLMNPPVREPDLAAALAITRVEPNRPWTDTGLTDLPLLFGWKCRGNRLIGLGLIAMTGAAFA